GGGDSVVLSNDSLKETGKNPSKSPKHFKHAEIRTRELLRRMDDFRQEMSVDDRAILDKIEPTIRKIHDELLLGIMGVKRDR
ncbi:MAG: hypothetical protein M1541_10730, partial [Acidobacteria bacterium]|nr:hypothetical protein [Acidobacteriota bacterium]